MYTKRLIFVDDDDLLIDIVKIITSSLEETRDLPKYFFNSGDDFLLQDPSCTKTHENILFLDLNMPGMDGWQVLDELLKSSKTYSYEKVFILSSSIHPKDKERALIHPLVTDYIEKPLSKSKILYCLADIKEKV
ncbi:response regulator [Flammeovirga pacifica]|uniref:Response regulatory domain-containing protein n=1 Tax=Flammeovirga pacifica TaxID=915059 RepID=A0A1S1Z5D3_FLAPC|nr:response regulator [Flammeovirga pacifica]OHX68480.1 hypothetical protein NH26_07185 [Flammeovirga pacifica]